MPVNGYKTEIVLHHSLTKDSGTVSWDAIERYHRETNGWADIGYHFGVEEINGVYYALLGRPEHKRAAAVKEGMANEKGIHICLVGNFDLAPPPEAMIDLLVRRVLIPVTNRWQIKPDKIFGHHDYASYKSCPGTQFPLDEIRRRVAI